MQRYRRGEHPGGDGGLADGRRSPRHRVLTVEQNRGQPVHRVLGQGGGGDQVGLDAHRRHVRGQTVGAAGEWASDVARSPPFHQRVDEGADVQRAQRYPRAEFDEGGDGEAADEGHGVGVTGREVRRRLGERSRRVAHVVGSEAGRTQAPGHGQPRSGLDLTADDPSSHQIGRDAHGGVLPNQDLQETVVQARHRDDRQGFVEGGGSDDGRRGGVTQAEPDVRGPVQDVADVRHGPGRGHCGGVQGRHRHPGLVGQCPSVLVEHGTRVAGRDPQGAGRRLPRRRGRTAGERGGSDRADAGSEELPAVDHGPAV